MCARESFYFTRYCYRIYSHLIGNMSFCVFTIYCICANSYLHFDIDVTRVTTNAYVFLSDSDFKSNYRRRGFPHIYHCARADAFVELLLVPCFIWLALTFSSISAHNVGFLSTMTYICIISFKILLCSIIDQFVSSAR